MSKPLLLERTTEVEVFDDMDNFDLLSDSSTFALSLRLQFPKFSKGFTSSDFESFVKSHVGESNLVSLGRLSFPNEWQMQVSSKDIREKLIRMGRTKIKARTCWIFPLSQSEVRGYIHWLPTAYSNAKLEAKLRENGEVLFIENQKQTQWISKVDSDTRYFALYLKSGKTMDDVPHFLRIDDYYGLVTIRGRNPACFHCKEIGHKKAECKKFREKLGSYCSRPAKSGFKRKAPRGKRFSVKTDEQVKAIHQEIQTSAKTVSCTECLQEQLAELNVKAGSLSVTDHGSENKVSFTAESGKVIIKRQFHNKLEFARSGSIPVLKHSEDFDKCLEDPSILQAQETVEKDAEIPTGPIGQLQELQRSIAEILTKTKADLENEFEAVRKNLLVKEIEKTALTTGGKKKKKKKKKKKLEVELTNSVSENFI